MKLALAIGHRVAAGALRRLLLAETDHAVLWTAHHGDDVLPACRQDPPDLLLLDLALPGADAVALTGQVRAACSCGVLVLSAGRDDVTRAFDALGQGAMDTAVLPSVNLDGELVGATVVLERVHTLSRLVPHASGPRAAAPPAHAAGADTAALPLIALGASTGGPAALATIFQALPGDLGAALVLVQHIDDGFVEGLASWLTGASALRVAIAREGDVPRANTVLVAAAGRHLVLRADGALGYVTDPVGYHSPSVDVLFASLAARRSHGMAVLLTGMGQDGAQGLLRLRRAGWTTVCQDQRTSAVFGMPRAGIELGAAELVLGLEAIAPTIAGYVARAARYG